MRLALLLALSASVCLGQAAWRVKQVVHLPSGVVGAGGAVCGEMDADSMADLTFWWGTGGYRWFWETWERQGQNQYALAHCESCAGDPNPPPGMSKGRFIPCVGGDFDGDSLADILGQNDEYFYTGNRVDSVREYLCVYESPSRGFYPDSLVWSYCFGANVGTVYHAWVPGDLDRDGRPELVYSDQGGRTDIFENRGDNQYDLVFRTPTQHSGYAYAFGDFDQDSMQEFAFAPVESHYVFVFECTGNDQYALTDSFLAPHRNGSDMFSGNDVDGDGKPEFFINYARYDGTWWTFYLYMYEATGNNSYAGVGVDSITVGDRNTVVRRSTCVDVDLDGAEEVLMSYGAGIRMFRTAGNNQFRKVWEWYKPTPPPYQCYVEAYDMTGNGYPDIVASGNGQTWMFEMEAIKVVAPNRRVDLVPGETCDIRWRIFTPPRCDSVSLFLRRDTLWPWVLDTIATGLAPMDSVYSWRVPPGPVDSCRIVAIAYGPGWQYDESDTAFRILPGGVAEAATGAPPRAILLPPAPNPFSRAVQLGFALNQPGRVALSVYDASGRRARLLFNGECAAGASSVRWDGRDDNGHALPTGVYVVRLAVGAETRARRLVLVR